MSIFDIRRATARDLDQMVSIENDCFDSDRLSRRQMRYLLCKAKASIWVAEDGGAPVAYGICLTPKLPRPARLYSLAVLGAYRGAGIAAQMMREMKSSLIKGGYRFWRLEVDEHNDKAINLYRQMGFEQIGTLPEYYQSGHNGIRLQLAL